MTRSLSVLGATGSVGRSTLDVVAQMNAEAASRGEEPAFTIAALSAGRDVAGLCAAARAFHPRVVALADPDGEAALRDGLAGLDVDVHVGPDAAVRAAKAPCDIAMAAITGAAGLGPTLEIARQGASVALANKEALVCAGGLFLSTARAAGAVILPVDSEHNAIFQVLDRREAVERLILTASGGPFRTASAEDMARATPEEACAHPNWSMGRKISVDSATMMNKGLELIEASLLFDMPEDRVDVVFHPQSVVHSLVAYTDGSVLAQLGAPDMRIPIASALAWPRRCQTNVARLDLTAIGRLDFEPPDLVRFPALRLAREALRAGGGAPTVLNAANEVAVGAFLDRNLAFPEIAAIVAETLDIAARQDLLAAPRDLDDVAAIDQGARRIAMDAMAAMAA